MAEIVVPQPPLSPNLNGSEQLVTPDGRPSPYFMRYLFDQNGYLTDGARELARLVQDLNGLSAVSAYGTDLRL